MTERPPFGTAPIRCGKTKCSWRGLETDLAEKKEGMWSKRLCPTCGCDSYSFMTAGEIKAWERKRAALTQGDSRHE